MALALGAASCGGGGGGNNEDPPPTPSKLKVLARDGNTFPGDFQVQTIESANMSDDQTVAIIASESGTPSLNGVFLRSPNGQIRRILTPGDSRAEGLSFASVRNPEMAATGEFAFEVGNQLDNDGLFLWDGNELQTLARTAPGETPEGFRILGALRVARDGLVLFTDGTSPCEVDNTNPNDPDISCDLRIYTAQNGVVSQVEVPNALTNQTPTSVILEVNDRGETAVGLSARGNEPLVGLIRDGVFEGLLPRRGEIEGLGVLFSARPRAISPTGAIALDGFFDTDGDGQRDEEWVMIYDNGQIQPVERNGGNFQGNPEVDVRAEGIDRDNQIVYRVIFESDEAGRNLTSLRAWKDGRRSYIAHEGMEFVEDHNGDPQDILDIDQVRVGVNGDVVFVARLGIIDEDTGDRRISGRRLIRWNGGPLETLLELGAEVDGGVLVNDISIADINSNGDLLIISSIDRSATRVLLLLPRKDPDELA